MKKKQLPDKIHVRAFYESNRLSHKSVAEYFENQGYSISHKTIEKWSANGEWKKNSYTSYEIALEQAKNKVTEENKGIDKATLNALNYTALVNEIALNLTKTKKIVDETNLPMARKIYQEMLLKIYDRTQQGKESKITLKVNPDKELSKPLEDMTFEELEKLRIEYERY